MRLGTCLKYFNRFGFGKLVIIYKPKWWMMLAINEARWFAKISKGMFWFWALEFPPLCNLIIALGSLQVHHHHPHPLVLSHLNWEHADLYRSFFKKSLIKHSWVPVDDITHCSIYNVHLNLLWKDLESGVIVIDLEFGVRVIGTV